MARVPARQCQTPPGAGTQQTCTQPLHLTLCPCLPPSQSRTDHGGQQHCMKAPPPPGGTPWKQCRSALPPPHPPRLLMRRQLGLHIASIHVLQVLKGDLSGPPSAPRPASTLYTMGPDPKTCAGENRASLAFQVLRDDCALRQQRLAVHQQRHALLRANRKAQGSARVHTTKLSCNAGLRAQGRPHDYLPRYALGEGGACSHCMA
jgi:hypothetical protein